MKKIKLSISALSIAVIMLVLTACQSTTQTDNLLTTANVKEISVYGSAILDITGDEFSKMYSLGDTFDVTVPDKNFSQSNVPFFDGYYGNYGRILLVDDSTLSGLALSAKDSSIDPSITVGDTVKIKLNTKSGALKDQEAFAIKYTTNREDYETDEIFANAREVRVGNIKEKTLFRSASPFNDIKNRASYASKFAEQNNVKTVLNLSDSEENLKDLYDTIPNYSKSLLDNSRVIFCKLGVSYKSDNFSKILASGLEKMSEKDGAYLVHCIEGKDRTGYVCMVLEALCGASKQEIIDDYMLTYANYYGVTQTSDNEKYNLIKNSNIIGMLQYVTSTSSEEELNKADLQSCCEKYLKSIGLSDATVANLKAKLTK